MTRDRKHPPEQIVGGEIEVSMANGKPTDQACRQAGIVNRPHSRWRKEYGGLLGNARFAARRWVRLATPASARTLLRAAS